MGGFVLLLLVGVDLVSWRWLAAFPAAALAAGVLRTFRRRPTAYQTARLLDERLHLADTLSTAIFYWQRRFSREADEAMRLGQRRQAIETAERMDLRTALPMRIPRPVLLPLIVLTFLAAGLALLRYRVNGTLDLRRPAIAFLQQWERELITEVAKLDSSLDAPERAMQHAESDAIRKRGRDNNGRGDRQDGQRGDEELGSGDGAMAYEQAGDQQPGAGSSLLSKLSDSLADLASAVKSKPESAPAGQRGQEGGSGKERGSASRGRQTQSSGQSPESQAGAAESKTGAAESKENSSASDMSADANSGQSARLDDRGGSGAGKDDGKKESQLAKQLDAMGKISTILGKRSRDLSGSATIEVTSGGPELRTAYENRQAVHSSVTARSERDSIPIEFESYVQQYFRELRQQKK
jgi:hypothetical protein